MLSTPGTASAFTPSSYAQNECVTSSEVTWNATSVWSGRGRYYDVRMAVGLVLHGHVGRRNVGPEYQHDQRSGDRCKSQPDREDPDAVAGAGLAGDRRHWTMR